MRPQTIGLLASQGIRELLVGAQLRVSLVSTGDELAPAGSELQPGQIYDSNTALLQALLRQCGVHAITTTHSRDEAGAVERAVRAGLASDVMMITGGVSVGARDFVKGALAAAGVSLALWRVAVRPGKPFLFGRNDHCAVFGLPGNPVSAFVTFFLFVRPALLKLMGASEAACSLPEMRATLTAAVQNDGERPHYLRGVLARGEFTPIGQQESHAIFGLSRSNALLLVHPGQSLASGTDVRILSCE
jgi:molybdopterin molybdotransferase